VIHLNIMLPSTPVSSKISLAQVLSTCIVRLPAPPLFVANPLSSSTAFDANFASPFHLRGHQAD